mmetsp:Transcript_65123/g.178707  ORF Transcript_65123/g.178707 Transcript_65123/m.178707 type:complete len:214 (+) Transcript_65123:930-1571(+)
MYMATVDLEPSSAFICVVGHKTGVLHLDARAIAHEQSATSHGTTILDAAPIESQLGCLNDDTACAGMASQDGIHERDLATRDRECSLVCCAQAASAVSWDCLDGAVDQLKLTSFDPESTVKANSRDVDRRCAVLEHEQWRLQSGDGHVRTTINPHLACCCEPVKGDSLRKCVLTASNLNVCRKPGGRGLDGLQRLRKGSAVLGSSLRRCGWRR